MKKTLRTRVLRQMITFRATPKEVWEMLMDSKKLAKFTGSKATVSQKPGGRFSVFGGDLTGSIIKIKPGRRVTQSWHAKMKGWPKDHMSRVTFTIKKSREKGKSLLFLYHSKIPSGIYKDMKKGWHDGYWKPMKKMIKGGK